MGAYRFAVYFKPQLGFMVSYDYGFIILDLPFLKLMLNVPTLGEEADLELQNFQFSTNDK